LLIIFVTYSSVVFLFALFYLGVSKLGQHGDALSHFPVCDMDIHNYMEALYLSLSTMASIGYGVSNYYFGGCWTPLLLVLTQLCCAISLDAVAIGVLFQRISRGQKRAKTIVFSNNAVIQRVAGVPYLMFRLGELRRQHQLIEASVRAYCIRHERQPMEPVDGTANPNLSERVAIETTHCVTQPLKFVHEELSDHILMSLPQVLVHRMDGISPLRPRQSEWYDKNGIRHGYPWVTQRLGSPNAQGTATWAEEWAETKRFLADTAAEIVVLVEGTDDLTGSAIQTRHSYTVNDIRWDEEFVSCIRSSSENESGERSEDRELSTWKSWSKFRLCQRLHADSEYEVERQIPAPTVVVDFARFQQTRRALLNASNSPYLPQTCSAV
jgi:Inward rectifier potassium channel transmembrane domain/Inward rectifier potassium channel C-terminal domain